MTLSRLGRGELGGVLLAAAAALLVLATIVLGGAPRAERPRTPPGVL